MLTFPLQAQGVLTVAVFRYSLMVRKYRTFKTQVKYSS